MKIHAVCYAKLSDLLNADGQRLFAETFDTGSWGDNAHSLVRPFVVGTWAKKYKLAKAAKAIDQLPDGVLIDLET